MCGIAGFSGAEDPAALQAMANALAHRGPDGESYFFCPKYRVSLAHRRLAIIDLPGGGQPMWNEDDSVGVVFNGEIYNHGELRRELEGCGHIFKSDHSDTETLIHGFEQWGTGLLDRLNGMFAFCIYDRARRQLFFARDRFGEKPLYYSLISGGIAFASELKALLKHPEIPRSIDSLAVKKYFAYGFIPAPGTLYRQVYKLPAGHRMTFDLASRQLSVSRYYRYSVAPDQALISRDENDVAEELRACLLAATKRRLVADRPVGIFLSGGIDSSSILACAASVRGSSNPKTFSIGFNEKSFDESSYARLVAGYFATEHREEVLDITSARNIAELVIKFLDEPMGDSSLLPTYLLAKFVRKHVVVALSGDGGDELFAGYAPFRALSPAVAYTRFLPEFVRRGVRRSIDCLPTSDRYLSLDFQLKRTLRGLAYPQSMWNPAWLSPLEPCDIEVLLGEPASPELIYEDAIKAWETSEAPDLIGKTSEFYTQFYLQDGVLAKVDRATMMTGLEARAPFLDNDVVDFARRLPSSLKYRHGQGKYILKRAMRGHLPDEILDRPKKGFGIPITSWLKNWSFPESSSKLQYNKEKLSELVASHKMAKTDERLFLWCWLVLQGHLNNVETA